MPSSAGNRDSGVVGRIAEELRQQIKSGRLTPGQRLVEVKLAEDLGVSRGSVREAINRLDGEGLLEPSPHRTATVRQMSRAFVAELFAVRGMLEGGAARIATETLSSRSHRQRLKEEAADAKRWTKASDVSGYADSNERFHNLVVEIADNDLLSQMLDQLQTHAYRVLFVSFLSPENVKRSAEQHLAITEAILKGDAEEAEKQMRHHIQSTAEQTLALENPFFQ